MRTWLPHCSDGFELICSDAVDCRPNQVRHQAVGSPQSHATASGTTRFGTPRRLTGQKMWLVVIAGSVLF
ncbi:hypothetical protein RBWH47_04650 [Rhodopirellula baltica WH47]|uniref:Uncharacterized protein n=1 Tax=Rhodopirellula baltica WH47 TaxID=991778 RepID=F2ASG3_RHOBT|nr:hypothetical protein RBWH47_04650 [Rhodopirellula baltica WH47]